MNISDVLDPTKRKALYALLLAAGTLLVTFNVATELDVANWVEVIVQVAGFVGIVIMAVKTKRFDFKGIYAAAATLVGALTVAGVLTDGAASQSLDTLAQLGVAFAAYQAFVRTNTTVPTGQPLEEVAAEQTVVVPEPVDHMAPDVGLFTSRQDRPHRVDEGGWATEGVVITIAAVVVILCGLVWLLQNLG